MCLSMGMIEHNVVRSRLSYLYMDSQDLTQNIGFAQQVLLPTEPSCWLLNIRF